MYEAKYRNLFTVLKYHIAFLCADLLGGFLDLHSPHHQCSTVEARFNTHYPLSGTVCVKYEHERAPGCIMSGLEDQEKKGFKLSSS